MFGNLSKSHKILGVLCFVWVLLIIFVPSPVTIRKQTVGASIYTILLVMFISACCSLCSYKWVQPDCHTPRPQPEGSV